MACKQGWWQKNNLGLWWQMFPSAYATTKASNIYLGFLKESLSLKLPCICHRSYKATLLQRHWLSDLCNKNCMGPWERKPFMAVWSKQNMILLKGHRLYCKTFAEKLNLATGMANACCGLCRWVMQCSQKQHQYFCFRTQIPISVLGS